MTFYDRKILPRLIDFACGTDLFTNQRRQLIPSARGTVLEIGFGSGLNTRFYDPQRVHKLWGVEPSEKLRALAQARMPDQMPIEFIGLSGESIPLESGTVDTVVTTYTLCTIPDVGRALDEMRRVLKPGGTLLFAEHGRAPDAAVRCWQDRLDPLWKRVAGGCHLNRDIPLLIREAGFKMGEVEAAYLPGPKLLTFNYLGSAQPAKC